MPAPKYYCDYCDKQFQDTPASRKRHLQGSLHQRAKKQWFDSFRDQEEVKRGVCAYFMRTGTCQYGTNCKYSHPTQPVSHQFGSMSSDSNMHGLGITSPSTPMAPTIPIAVGGLVRQRMENKLPPSLQPPPEAGYHPLAPVDWG